MYGSVVEEAPAQMFGVTPFVIVGAVHGQTTAATTGVLAHAEVGAVITQLINPDHLETPVPVLFVALVKFKMLFAAEGRGVLKKEF